LLSHVSAREEISCCDDDNNKVKLFPNGTRTWYHEYRLSVSHCEIDITWFPFDNQACDLVFESKTYDKDDLVIKKMSPAVELDSYVSSGEWDLMGKMSASDDYTLSY